MSCWLWEGLSCESPWREFGLESDLTGIDSHLGYYSGVVLAPA